METVRTKEEIHQMIRYVLNSEDMDDEHLVAHWTDVLFELHKIRQKFPRPTSALLEMNNQVHSLKKMSVGHTGLKIDSNHQEKWLENNTPDVKVYGDITIDRCERDLTVVGNINGNDIKVEGDLNTDTLCNVGNLIIYCDKLNIDNFRVSGTVTINAKEILCSDFISDKSVITGNIKTTFFNSNKTEITGNVVASSITGTSDENFKVDLNKPQ